MHPRGKLSFAHWKFPDAAGQQHAALTQPEQSLTGGLQGGGVLREMRPDQVIHRFPEKAQSRHSDASVSVAKPSEEMSNMT